MASATGIVINVAQHRRAPLLGAIEGEDVVAEAIPQFAHSRNLQLVAFLSFEHGKITHLSMARRGVRAGTGLSRLNLTDVITLPAPLAADDILAAMPKRYRALAEDRLSSGGLLPPATFTAMVDAIRNLSEASRPLLDRFSETRRLRIAALGVPARNALAYQKETIATALALADIDRTALQHWEPPEAGLPESFLDGLENARVREDPMVLNDMMQVPGFKQIRAMRFGAAVFESEAVRLTVVLANRLPLEQQLGADLIYYNETFKSFVIVQYKAMEKLSDGGSVFRLPNSQLADEIARMDTTLAVLRDCVPEFNRHSFRLGENPFFLKLCSRILFNPEAIIYLR